MAVDLPPDDPFLKKLNSNGYGFQYSVIRLADTLYNSRKSGWKFVWAEFPVSVQGQDTRIDLVLQNGRLPYYILGECKRVNPALGHWCFTSAPYTHPGSLLRTLYFDAIDVMSLAQVAAIDPQRPYRLISSVYMSGPQDVFHLGVEIRTNKKGDPQGAGGRGAIEEAIGQILRGVNGMVDYFVSHQSLLRSGSKVVLAPVIFTTANLWISAVDLGTADLATGRLDTAPLKEVSWLWLNYNQSPGFKHSLAGERYEAMDDILQAEYTRSVAVVNALGIEDFLRQFAL
jgi:hypothetical protein